ncbi:MAG: hypothetical protein ACRD47_14325 [Nitrososphaeraceae archaeon]
MTSNSIPTTDIPSFQYIVSIVNPLMLFTNKRLQEEPVGKHAILEDPEGNLISMADIDAEHAHNKFHIIMELHHNDNERCAYVKSAYPTNWIVFLKEIDS